MTTRPATSPGPHLCALVIGVWLGCAVCATGLRAQSAAGDSEFLIRNWDPRNGLSRAPITAIQRTTDGYLWLGTRNGVVRFDGVRFRVFDLERTPGVRTNLVTSLLADRHGNLWIGTVRGLIRAGRGSLALTNAPVAWAGGWVAALAEDREGTVWAAVPNVGLIGSRAGDGAAVTNRLALQPGAQLVAGSSNQVWLLSGANLWFQSGAGWTNVTDRLPARTSAVGAISSSPGDDVWLATGRRVFRLNHPEPLPVPQDLANPRDAPAAPVTALREDRAGRIWAGTQAGGVFCFSPERGWRRVTAQRGRSLGAVGCFFEDPEGSLWVGMSAGGLQQIKPRGVTAWSLPVAAHESIPHTVCAARDGSVWVGTDGAGAFRYKDGNFTRFGPEQGLNSLTVVAIYEDRHTNLWFGTVGGLFEYADGLLKPVTTSPLSGNLVSALFEDRKGNLWFGATGAVVRRGGGRFDAFKLPPGRQGEPLEVRGIAQDAAGSIWAGTRNGGLFRFRSNGFEHFNGFRRPAVIALHGDAEGALWIGTLNSGLCRLADGRVRQWTTADGLPDNTVYSIIEDDAGWLWMSSNQGIFGLSKNALTSHPGADAPPLLPLHPSVEDGLPDNASLGSGQPAASKSADGRLWFPTLQGVVSVQPARLLHDRLPGSVQVEEVSVDGVPLNLGANDELRLPSSLRRLEFHFTSPDMSAPSRLHFRYRLEGFDDDWTDAGSQREARYGRLAPGRYRFRVMAGTQGDWRSSDPPLAFQVVPRFWERRVFQAGAMIASLALVALLVWLVERARSRRKRARLEMQQAMERERARIAKDLHDDLGTAITEIMLLGELARREEGASAPLRAHAATITEKARQLAVAMDETVWTVNPKNDSLPNLASYLSDFAREFFGPTQIRCRFDLADNVPPIALSAAQRHNLFLAVKEALNNVARHSGASEVWLRLRWAEGRLKIFVEDNGHGFDARKIGAHSNGLHNLRARLETIGGRAEVTSQPGQGAKAEFTLPLPGGDESLI